MRRTVKVILVSLLTTVFLVGCSKGPQENSYNKKGELDIVTTFYPVYEFTKQIVGNEGKVSLLVPAGAEPHDYEPSAKDMAHIQDADAFVYHDENMEMWVPKAQKSWKKGSPNVIQGTKNMILVPGDDSHSHEHDHEEEHHHELDPHTWLAPSLAIKEVESIRDQLNQIYPEKKSVFDSNAQTYLTELEQLDKRYKASLSQAKQKTFVTQHAAFGYLALEYDLIQEPIAGLSPDREPTAAKLAELKDFIKEHDTRHIYFEENVNAKIAKTLADETNVTLSILNPLESLTQEKMDKGENYVSVMEDNLVSLEKTTQRASSKKVKKATETLHKTVSNGYFEDKDVMDRSLADYEGRWQSVYPLLQKGALDQVFDYKSKVTKDMTAEEYKNYYTQGYQTDVDKVVISGNTMDFIVNGEHHSYTYHYKGYEILTYKKGNRGVRFIFETDDKEAGRFKYVQFSDHGIAPKRAEHFHIYFGGESQEALLKEVTHWPTYYPEALSQHDIAQEMIAH